MVHPIIGRSILNATKLRRRMRGPLRPSWSPETEAHSRLLHHYSRRSHWLPLDWQRKALASMVPVKPPRGVGFERFDIGGIEAAWLTPDGADEDRVLLYLHGGGYLLGSIDSHRHAVSRFARAARMRTLLIDYRLAPEHPFPAGLEDAITSWRWLLESGVDPARAAIAGESAGGGLTMATLLSLRERGLPMPGAAAVLSPWVDLTLTGGTLATNDRFDFIPRHILRDYAEKYANGADRGGPLLSPAFANLSGLPPLLIQAGEAETLLDDSRRLHERARAAGTEASLTVYPDMIHAFMLMPHMPGHREAVDELGEHLRAHTGG